MVEIIQDFIPKGKKNRPGHKLVPEYITVHDTGNSSKGAGAKAHAKYIKSDTATNAPVSWHFSVDDKEIYQHLPLSENGWHAGDGSNGVGNRKSIGIEICENSDGNRDKAEENAAWLVAKLLKELNLDINKVKQHNVWKPTKNCPHILREKGWDNFLGKIERHLIPTPTGLAEELKAGIDKLATENKKLKAENDTLKRDLGIAEGKLAQVRKIAS